MQSRSKRPDGPLCRDLLHARQWYPLRREARVGKVDYFHLIRLGIKDTTTELTTIVAVPSIASGAWIDHQHPPYPAHDLHMGVAIQHVIGIRLGEAGKFRAVRMHVLPARLPWRGMDHQELLVAKDKVFPMWLLCQEGDQVRVEAGPFPCAAAGGGEEDLLMVALDDMRAALLQQAYHFVRELIFKDRIPEAKQFIDMPHRVKRKLQSAGIAVDVRNDSDFH